MCTAQPGRIGPVPNDFFESRSKQIKKQDPCLKNSPKIYSYLFQKMSCLATSLAFTPIFTVKYSYIATKKSLGVFSEWT